LKPLLERIQTDSNLVLQLIVTGAHLSPEFGLTYKQIEKDKFAINKKIDIDLSSDNSAGIAKSMGIALMEFGKAYAKLGPDIVVLLGDRYEIFSAASAAAIARIPIAHISGGEVTQGAIDDVMRHAITKMSSLHFTAAKRYRDRVVQLGEDPKRVFNLGSLALDNIKNLKLLSKSALEKEMGFKFNKRNIVVTFHPATIEREGADRQFSNLLQAIDDLKDTNIIFTKANADSGGKIINKMITDYVGRNRGKAAAFVSLGCLRYLSLLQYVDAAVGNSSSGISEAPSFKIGTINIGDRQKGRIKAKSIIDCKPTKKDIMRAFKRVYSRGFQDSLKAVVNPYGGGNIALKIQDILKKCDLTNIIKKKFYDIYS
jgi:GDP/UDP-N,N'-diacetylbacillosamine 2-epimerase (hydrolysing)